MEKDALEAAIAAIEAWGRTVDNWVLICAAVVAVSLTAEVVFSVAHWRNENTLRPLRSQLAVINAKELAAMGERAAKAEKETAELYKAVSPRRLTNQKGVADAMKPFAPVTAVVEYPLGDREAKNLASLINSAFFLAGWKVQNPIARAGDDIERDTGVFVSVKWSGVPFAVPIPDEVKRAVAAQGELIKQLESREIKTKSDFAPDNLPLGTLLVKVSPAPDPEETRAIKERKKQSDDK